MFKIAEFVVIENTAYRGEMLYSNTPLVRVASLTCLQVGDDGGLVPQYVQGERPSGRVLGVVTLHRHGVSPYGVVVQTCARP